MANTSGKGAGVAYQPSYTIQPKYGFRYLSQPFVNNVSAGINQPTVPVLTSPPNNESAYNNNTSNVVPVMDSNTQNENEDSTTPDYSNISQTRGYEKGVSNPLSVVPYIGGFLAEATDSPEYNFGEPGTTDAYGNIFADNNRSYNPMSGDAYGYTGPGAFYDGVTDSYSKLREAGANPIASALGSYENSMYNIPRDQRAYGANAAGQQGIRTTTGDIRYNTAISNPNLIFTEPVYGGPGGVEILDYKDPFTGELKSEFFKGKSTGHPGIDSEFVQPSYRDITLADMGLQDKGGSGISAFQQNVDAGMPTVYGDREKLGEFTQIRTGEESSDYAPTIGEGSVVNTNFGPGVVNSSGQVETAQGTVIQMDGVNDGNVIQKPTQPEDTGGNSGGK